MKGNLNWFCHWYYFRDHLSTKVLMDMLCPLFFHALLCVVWFVHTQLTGAHGLIEKLIQTVIMSYARVRLGYRNHIYRQK